MVEGACGVGIDNGKSIKCPVCKNLVIESRGFDKCHHCGYELSEMYVQESLKEVDKKERGYLKVAIIVVPSLISIININTAWYAVGAIKSADWGL